MSSSTPFFKKYVIIFSITKLEVFMRLEHLIMKHFDISRKQMKKIISSGEVLIDSIPATHVSNNVDPQIQVITVQGKQIVDSSQKYFMLNKPSGLISATTDEHLSTVIDLFSKENVEGLYPIGRLDRDTLGLLIITNNGPLGYRLLNPVQHIEKEYYVEVNGPLDSSCIQRFHDGIVFHDGTICKPAILSILESSPSFSKASVVISEGKFHQIKKMFLCIGVKVTFLKRIRFGEFLLDDSLSPGEYRPLNPFELQLLKQYFD